MLNIDLMIFDLDGTLIDSKKDIVSAVSYMLKKMRFKERPYDDIISYIGTGVRDLVAKSIGEENRNSFDEALTVFRDYYKEHSTDQTRPYPGAVNTLKHFKGKTKVIVTNRDREFAKLTIDLLGLGGYFEGIIGGDDQNCVKPMACPLNSILSRFNVERSKVIMIGDMDLDIMAGKNAGVYTCGVTYGIGKKEDIIKAQPDFIIDNISELNNIVG
ncbi:MAG: HAD-IA family hydrolase [Candidatus Omnitrophota bacterium]